MDNKSSTFCALPWLHLEARTDGRVGPCCMSQQFVVKDDGSSFFLFKDDIKDAYNSQWIQKLRKNLDKGIKHPNCEICWKEEAIGQESKRIRENRRFKETLTSLQSKEELPKQPIFLDLKLGNTCNLKCRICGPYSSSKWVEESVDLFGEDSLPYNQTGLGPADKAIAKKKMMNWDENPTFWQALEDWLPKIEYFEIFGGEPFLIKRHFEVLKLSIARGYSKNQSLHYNTNGTIYPEEAIKNIFPHFKKVHIMLSVDGIGEQFEYQRFPAKWEIVMENLVKFQQVATIEICLTLSALNIYYLDTYLEFWFKHNVPVYINILNTPIEYNYQILPLPVKDAIVEKLKKMDFVRLQKIVLNNLPIVLDSLMANDQSYSFNQFVKFVNIHDKYRKQSFQTYFPEYYELLQPYFENEMQNLNAN